MDSGFLCSVCFIFADKICDSETLGMYNSQNTYSPINSPRPLHVITGQAQLTEDPGKLKLFLDGFPEGECK